MAVEDHGLEVLKKSAEQVTPGDKSDYYIKVKGEITNFPSGSDLTTYVDDLESLITSSNALLTAIKAAAEATGGYVDGVEGLLTDIKGFVDQLESKLDTVGTNTGNTATAVESIDSKLTSDVIPDLESIDSRLAGIDAQLGNIETEVSKEATQLDVKTAVESLDGKTKNDTKYATGNLINNGDSVEIDCEGYGGVVAHIGPGIGAFGDIVNFECSINGTDWFPGVGCDLYFFDGQLAGQTDHEGAWAFCVVGLSKLRLRWSGTTTNIPIYMRAEKNPAIVQQVQALTFVTASDPLATAARQDAILAAIAGLQTTLTAIDTKLGGTLTVQGI